MAVPTKDLVLVGYAKNFSERVSASAATYGLTTAQASALSLVQASYQEAMDALNAPGARSPANLATKNQAKGALLPVLRELYALVQANLSVSDADKSNLGITVRTQPTPIPVPATWPSLDIIETIANKVKVRIHADTGDGKRSKPAGVVGAAITSYTGPNPEDPTLYKWEGSTNRSVFEVAFPDSLPPGTVVYISAMWLNAKNQNGPACPPVPVTIQFVQGFSNKEELKIAA